MAFSSGVHNILLNSHACFGLLQVFLVWIRKVSSSTEQEFVATLPEFALLIHLLFLEDLFGQNLVCFS